jgi:uncharacterized membrane protein YozB (DUF420 family)
MEPADWILLAELAMGLALIGGAVLAQKRYYRAHGCVQATVVLLNLTVIGWYMVPPFVQIVVPRIPAHLGRSYFALATAHGLMGILAEILALYVLLSAGTPLLPKRLRFTRYKFWMRTTLVLWWLAIGLGVATWARWHGYSRQ